MDSYSSKSYSPSHLSDTFLGESSKGYSRLSHIYSLFNFKLIALCIVWYLTSVLSSASTKLILRDFKYPVSLTEIQFVINAFLCLLLLLSIRFTKTLLHHDIHRSFPNGTFPPSLITPNYSITKNFLTPTFLVLKTTVPMGMFQFLGQIASHNSTSIIPVSLVHTIKALSPLTTVLIYRFLFGKHFPLRTYITLLPLMLGVMLSCTRNDKLQLSNDLFWRGSLFAFLSMLIFVSQNIFAKKILTWDSNDDKKNNTLNDNACDYLSSKDQQEERDDDRRAKAFLDRFNWKITRSESAASTPILPISIASNSPPSFNYKQNSPFSLSNPSLTDLVLQNEKYHVDNQENKKLDKLSVLFYCSIVGFVLTLPFYLVSEFNNPIISLYEITPNVLHNILLYGVSHFIQSLTAFQILGMVSPVNYSIANILKRIIIICCSIIIEGVELGLMQRLGLILTFIGLYCYDKWGVQRNR